MSITLDAIELPPDLEWVDEYKWSAVHQQKTLSLKGALIVEESVQQKGREITLEGKRNAGAITKATLDLLRAKTETAGLVMTLSYFGQTYSVMFRRDIKSPIDARLIIDYRNPGPDDYYSFKIYLMEV